MPRTFTEAEAQKVFARVAERQRAAGTSAPGGLSLADLEEAAQAAGLDPALVATAAAELDAPDDARRLLGAPTEVVRQRVIRGAVSDESWEAIVAAARTMYGQDGVAGQVGRVREWSVSGGGRRGNAVTTRLSLEPAGADTRLVLSTSARHAAVMFTAAGAVQWLLAAGFAVASLASADAGFWFPVVMMAAMATLLIGGSQVGLRLWERQQQRRSDAFLDRVDLLTRDAAPPATPATRTDPAGRIDPALFDADAPETDADAAHARTRA